MLSIVPFSNVSKLFLWEKVMEKMSVVVNNHIEWHKLIIDTQFHTQNVLPPTQFNFLLNFEKSYFTR